MAHMLIAMLTLSQITSRSYAVHLVAGATSAHAHSCKADAVNHMCGKAWITRTLDRVLGNSELVSIPLKHATSPADCRQTCIDFEATRFKISKQEFLRKLKGVASVVGPAGYSEDWAEVEDDIESSFCCEFDNGQCSLTYSPAQPVQIAKIDSAHSFLNQRGSKGADVNVETKVAWECSIRLNKDDDLDAHQILTWSGEDSDEESVEE